MTKTNKEVIAKKITPLVIGCYDEKMETLNKTNLKKVLNELEYDLDTRIEVFINRKKHIIEVCNVDDEVDFEVLTMSEFNRRNGEQID